MIVWEMFCITIAAMWLIAMWIPVFIVAIVIGVALVILTGNETFYMVGASPLLWFIFLLLKRLEE